MKSVGKARFRDKASQYIASKEAVAVFRHGKLVGFYIPVPQSEEEEISQVLQRLNQTVSKAILAQVRHCAIASSGMDEAAEC